jgi:oligopeptide/dipeptide ABC transporter ATP-binding protein
VTAPLLEVRALVYRYRNGALAVNGVSFDVARHETFALVGESGSGKSTVARAIVRLLRPAAGSVHLDGVDLAGLTGRALRAGRRRFQIVFQDPFSSLNPRLTAGDAVAEGLEIHRIGAPGGRGERVAALFSEVGLDPSRMEDYPHRFSGGERQRLALARALAVDPELLVLDEPVSALDVLVRAQILDLLTALQRRRGLACVFIGHDLATVDRVAHRIGVMYAGRMVEMGPAGEVLRAPMHPYTVALRSAVPTVEPGSGRQRIKLPGEPTGTIGAAAGCGFAGRCWHPARDIRCTNETPALQPIGTRFVACHYSRES